MPKQQLPWLAKWMPVHKNAVMVKAAEADRLAIGALADAVAYSNAVVAGGGTAFIFAGDVTMATQLEADAKAFVTMYGDVIGSLTERAAQQLNANAARAAIEGAKLKATWNARRRFTVGDAAYTGLTTQYDAIKLAIDTVHGNAAMQFTNLSDDFRYMGVFDLASIRRVQAEVLFHEVLTAVATGGTNPGKLVADLRAYVNTAKKQLSRDMEHEKKEALLYAGWRAHGDYSLDSDEKTGIINSYLVKGLEGVDPNIAKKFQEDESYGRMANIREVCNELEGLFEELDQMVKKARRLAPLDEGEEDFVVATSAMEYAKKTSEPSAAVNAAEAYEVIGGNASLDGRVRVEAYHNAADAYIMAEDWMGAGMAYAKSAELWMSMGDHMQAGNMYEKAAEALANFQAWKVSHRVSILNYLVKASKQLRTAGEINRIGNLTILANREFQHVEWDPEVSAPDLANGIAQLATILTEEAIAESNAAKAAAAEARLEELLEKVDAKAKEGVIHTKLGDLRMLQNKYADAADSYVKSAENYVDVAMLIEALESYRMAADAALKGAQGLRIQDSIFPAVLRLLDAQRNPSGVSAEELHRKITKTIEHLSGVCDS